MLVGYLRTLAPIGRLRPTPEGRCVFTLVWGLAFVMASHHAMGLG